VSHELSDLLNRIGMLLGFISFWFVAPEFIGEERLKSLETALAEGLLKLPKTLRWIFRVLTVMAIVAFIVNYLSQRGTRLPEIPQSLLLTLGLTALGYLLSSVSQAVVKPIASRLAKDNRVRQRALLLGALLFTISFLLQFIATFQSSEIH
jgi:hydrogenase/urease accessory protein HupE